MISVLDTLEECNEAVRTLINSLERVKAEELNLDPRCGILYVGEDAIAIPKSNVKAVEYYGAFEYVEKEYRVEIWKYVFYLISDDRIAGHLEYYKTRTLTK